MIRAIVRNANRSAGAGLAVHGVPLTGNDLRLSPSYDAGIQRGMAQFGSASALGAEGPRFKSGYPDQTPAAGLIRGSYDEGRR